VHALAGEVVEGAAGWLQDQLACRLGKSPRTSATRTGLGSNAPEDAIYPQHMADAAARALAG
jgi:hypothetical protein